MIKLFEDYKAKAAKSNAANEAWGKDIENEKLEKIADETYKEEFDALMALINGIVEITNGQIDQNTAKQIIITMPDQLEAILALA